MKTNHPQAVGDPAKEMNVYAGELRAKGLKRDAKIAELLPRTMTSSFDSVNINAWREMTEGLSSFAVSYSRVSLFLAGLFITERLGQSHLGYQST